MSSALSAVPVPRRRQAAVTVGAFAALFLAIAVLAATRLDDVVIRIFAIIALVAAVFLGLVSWGVAHSIRIDAAPRVQHGCGCGHDHDMSAMTVRDGAAAAAPSPAPAQEAGGCGGGGCSCCG